MLGYPCHTGRSVHSMDKWLPSSMHLQPPSGSRFSQAYWQGHRCCRHGAKMAVNEHARAQRIYHLLCFLLLKLLAEFPAWLNSRPHTLMWLRKKPTGQIEVWGDMQKTPQATTDKHLLPVPQLGGHPGSHHERTRCQVKMNTWLSWTMQTTVLGRWILTVCEACKTFCFYVNSFFQSILYNRDLLFFLL